MENTSKMSTKETAACEDWEIAEHIVDIVANASGQIIGYTTDYEPTAQAVIDWANELLDRGSYDEVWKEEVKEDIVEHLQQATDSDGNLLWPLMDNQDTLADTIIKTFLADGDWSDDDPFQNGEDAEDDE